MSLDKVMAHKEDDDESDHVICIDSKDADDAAQVAHRVAQQAAQGCRVQAAELLLPFRGDWGITADVCRRFWAC